MDVAGMKATTSMVERHGALADDPDGPAAGLSEAHLAARPAASAAAQI
jgi:hypothetical protein